ncbi:sensor histidine kinase [Phytohabitans rumicis]|uniref:Oxygen sensor histidine kinase NreB n=1 Tax=Phytohabitans rumicis TaxID=1076125 RepID=A0A6V8KYI8_9ACTN|nr:sensor histidine kinase [Phytohabitans rumicis]GFJ87389.1 two-component sensor histidine kinase [Phytohabitans rumicis]
MTEPAGAVDFWQRYLAGWHILAGATILMVAVFVAIDDSTPFGRGIAMTSLALLLGWYALTGIPALRHEDDRLAFGYFVGVTVLLNGVFLVTMAGSFLLFMLNPQIFAMVRSWRVRFGVMALLYGEIGAWTLFHIGLNTHALSMVGLWVLIPMLFALLIGTYITGIIKQSRGRAELIDELRRTQAELAAERHEAGVRAERERLAIEIHDTLAQGFTSILMLAQAARVALDRDRETVESQLDLVERAARENLAEARALVAALVPPDLADRSLVEALVRLADRHTRDTGVPVDVAASGQPASSAPGTDAVLLRAAQEALANVRRHAGASTVHIALSRDDTSSTVAVTDNGQGFDPAAVDAGYGLRGMHNRAVAFGGTCTIESAPGAGTTVRVSLPEGRAM